MAGQSQLSFCSRLYFVKNFQSVVSLEFGQVSLRVVAIAMLAIFSSTLLTACQTATPPVEPHSPVMPVKLGKVDSAVMDDAATFLAVLKSRRSVPLRSQVAGEIEQILVRSGDKVAQGQLLLSLDDTKQQSAVRGLMANADSIRDDSNNVKETLKALQASLASRKARLEFTQQELTRYTDLFSQGAVSKESVEEHGQNLKIAESDLKTLESQVQAQKALVAKNEKLLKQCEAQLKEQQTQLRYFSIMAPQPGAIGDVPVKVGEYVTSSTVLTTLEEPGPLEVYINIPASFGEKLKVGLPIVYRNEDGGIVASGKVFFVSHEVNNADQSILVKALFENADSKLRTGQLVNVQVIWQRAKVLLVPTTAVTHLGGKDFLFVAEKVGTGGFVAKQKSVHLGEIEDEKYRVKSGVTDGESIVVSGVQNLTDGAPLNPQ